MAPNAWPAAIDSRTVLRAYAVVAVPMGLALYSWPLLLEHAIPGDPQTWYARTRISAAILAAFGCCAAGFAAVDEPVGRRKGLLAFAGAHVLFGAMLVMQWIAVLSPQLPAPVGWGPLVIGIVLSYLAITGPGIDLRPLPAVRRDPTRPGATRFAVRNKPALLRLRSEYEQQIRQAAQQEERARLARDLHDAVKQQLFVIQTAGATAQTRFDADRDGARAALEQVRVAAREAMSEMEAMLDQLQAAPVANAGLVALLRSQAEALGLRTGARVRVDIGDLPDESLVDPGARQAIARVAQESLSNVARHARAKNVTLSLAAADGRLVLMVRDDGAGFSLEGKPAGMGMSGMAARAAEVGATLEVNSVPDSGTTVRFSVPCLHPPSPAPYIRRAIVWTGVLAAACALLFLGRWQWSAPWTAAIVLVATFAAARYAVAAYWLARGRQQARA